MQHSSDDMMLSKHSDTFHSSSEYGRFDLVNIIAHLIRQWRILVLGAALGVAQAITSTPVYTSSMQIRIGTSDSETAREISGAFGISLDESQITTETHVFRSERIAKRVIDDLNLLDNSFFRTSPKNLKSHLSDWIRGWRGEGEIDIEVNSDTFEDRRLTYQMAVSILRSNMKVSQIRGGNIVNISYTSVSPELSTTIVNAIYDAYVSDQLVSKYEAAQSATNWLKERSDQLRVQSIRLDNSIEIFLKEKGISRVGGDLMSSISLEDLTEQINSVGVDLLVAENRRKLLQDIIYNNDTFEFVRSTASQQITNSLREKYL